MKQIKSILLVFFSMLFITTQINAAGGIILTYDFNQVTNAEQWLETNKFEVQKGPFKGLPFKLTAEKNRLYVKSNGNNWGLYIKKLKLEKAKKIRIFWGVEKFYTKGDDWKADLKRTALSITVSFGDKKISSGGFGVPGVPYFINLFISKNADNTKAYKGKYYTKGGRYLCPSCPVKVNEVVITEFEFLPTLTKEFGLKEVPKITGIAIGVDARGTSMDSIAFIEKIQFLD